MAEKKKDATPGDIGDYTDENSLAYKITSSIDRACDRADVLGALFHGIQTKDELSIDPITLETICNDISAELNKARKMICD